MNQGALQHIRVLDLTTGLGQMCSRALGDMGAYVIKVEPPDGDPSRLQPPFFKDKQGVDNSLRFIYENRSKRSVVIDINSEEGTRHLLSLVERVDIIVEDFLPGYLDNLGLGYQDLSHRNSGLIHVSITPFGSSGPYSHYKGGDLVTQAVSGLMYANGDDETAPCMAPFNITSYLACLQAAYGAILGLRARRKTGRGQFVDISRQEATISAEHPYIYRYSHENVITRREGKQSPFGAVNTYRCMDGGYANVSVYTDNQFSALARKVMDHPILSDEVWMERQVRKENREIIDDYIQEYADNITRDEFVVIGQKDGVPVIPVLGIDEFVNHPHTKERKYFRNHNHPIIGDHYVPGPPVRFSETDWEPSLAAPKIGEHTDEILENLDKALPIKKPRNRSAGKSQLDNNKLLPLSELRVADLTRVVAGPVATRYLATFGAEVIKIEEAGLVSSIDPQELNRCKLSCIVDARKPGGKSLIEEIVRISDVVVENFKPGVSNKLGIGYEELKKVNPGIIMIAMPGMGSDGPLRDYLAYGQQVMGLNGLTKIWGHADSSLDTRIKMPYADFVAGVVTALSIVAALEYRDETGQGQYIECAQLEATAHLLGVAYMDYMLNNRIASPEGNFSRIAAPHDVYPCAEFDSWCAIEVTTEAEWSSLVTVMGNPSWSKEEKFSSLSLRIDNKVDLDNYISQWTKEFSPRLLMLILQKAGIPAGMVSNGEELYYNPHLRSRDGSIVSIYPPDIGLIDYKGVNLKLSATPGYANVRSPLRGEHNAYVFTELLGLTGSQLSELERNGTIV